MNDRQSIFGQWNRCAQDRPSVRSWHLGLQREEREVPRSDSGGGWCGLSYLMVMALLTWATVTSAQEPLLPNDIRVSMVGAEQDLAAFPLFERPALAYNSVRDELLAGWIDNSGDLEAARIDRASGFVVPSVVLATGDIQQDGSAGSVDIVFVAELEEHFVVWQREAGSFGLQEQEIRVCIVSGIATVVVCDEVFSDPSDVFDIGSSGRRPSAAYSPVLDRLLVAFQWERQCIAIVDLDGGDLSGGGAAAPCVANSSDREARPHLAYNDQADEFLLVWHDERLIDGIRQPQIWGLRLDAAGDPLGLEFLISDAAPLNAAVGVARPDVVYNPQQNEYLVVWQADDTDSGVALGETEIFGQRIGSDGSELGVNDQRLTFVGSNGSTSSDGLAPQVAFDPSSGHYLLSWHADDPDFGLANEEFEVFVGMLDGATAAPLSGPVRLSDLGPNGDATYQGGWSIPVVTNQGSASVAWWGRERIFGIGPFDFWDEQEIFLQSLEIGFFQSGFESGDTSHWQAP